MANKNSIRFEEIIWYMPGSVYWKDSNGVYQGCNENQVKALGFINASDVIGKRATDLLTDQSLAAMIEKVDVELMESDKEIALEEGPLSLNGETTYYFTRKIPLHNLEGHVIGLLGVSLDITKRKLAEQEAVKAKEEAEAANRAKTEFLANMSHDVKTPLSGVISIAELLGQRLQGEDKQLIEDLHRCGEKLLRFFENCIELSKMDMAELQQIEKPFSLSQIVEAIQDLFTPSAIAKRLRFTTFIDPHLPPVLMGNQVNTYRIILNLIGNAIKFTHSGSVNLSVKVDHVVDDKHVVVKIIVQDTGPGIPKDKQQIIFEKMQRLAPSYHNKQEGHGIGLYIVDQYVRALRGAIDVVSEVGQGSTFTVTLPFKIGEVNDKNIVAPPKLTEKEVPSAAVPAVVRELSCRNAVEFSETAPRILLVEDNVLIQQVTQQLIQSVGARVDVAGSGAEALQLFAPGKYALVYMDVGLPDMDGYQASRALRQVEEKAGAESTPIIALTAHATLDIATFCVSAGMQGALSKPLSRLQAEQVLQHYVLHEPVAIEGLQFLEPVSSQFVEVFHALPVIDFSECVAIIGDEARAKEMLTMIADMLDITFIPEISSAYQQNDVDALKEALHKFLGSLCYVSAPALRQATLNFQDAVRKNFIGRELAFQSFLDQAERLVSVVISGKY